MLPPLSSVGSQSRCTAAVQVGQTVSSVHFETVSSVGSGKHHRTAQAAHGRTRAAVRISVEFRFAARSVRSVVHLAACGNIHERRCIGVVRLSTSELTTPGLIGPLVSVCRRAWAVGSVLGRSWATQGNVPAWTTHNVRTRRRLSASTKCCAQHWRPSTCCLHVAACGNDPRVTPLPCRSAAALPVR